MRNFPDIRTLTPEARKILMEAFGQDRPLDPESPGSPSVSEAVLALSIHDADDVVFQEYHFDALAKIGSHEDHHRFALIAGLQAVAWRALAKTEGADINMCQTEEAHAIIHHRTLRDLACHEKSRKWLH